LENWLRRYSTDRGKQEIGMLNGMGPTRMASIFPAVSTSTACKRAALTL